MYQANLETAVKTHGFLQILSISYRIKHSTRYMCFKRLLRVMFADSIEANVDAAAVHVDEGTQQLSKASTYQVRASCMLHGLQDLFVDNGHIMCCHHLVYITHGLTSFSFIEHSY